MKRTGQWLKKWILKIEFALVIAIVALAATAAFGALTSRIVFNIGATYTGSGGLGTAIQNLALDYSVDLTNGSGPGQANVLYSASRTLVEDANEVLDFYASAEPNDVLTDVFGTHLTMQKLKVLIIYNTSSDSSLKIGGGASQALGLFADASDIMPIAPNGRFFWSDPNGLNITTNKDLNLLHGGEGTANLVYKIIVIGVD